MAQVGHVPIATVAGAEVGTTTGAPNCGWLLPDRPGHDSTTSMWATGSPGPALGGLGVTSPGTLTLPGDHSQGGSTDTGQDGAGLWWLGARVYDPSTYALLSPDPLPPVLGAGWAGNPFSCAGNNPVNLSDPTGLRPLSDSDLQAWNKEHTTGLSAAGRWLASNWKYVAAGLVIGGLATAFLGPVWWGHHRRLAGLGSWAGGRCRSAIGGGVAQGLLGAAASGTGAIGSRLVAMSALGRNTFITMWTASTPTPANPPPPRLLGPSFTTTPPPPTTATWRPHQSTPLYVQGKGFTTAGQIQPGDHLRDNHGHPVTVHDVQPTNQPPVHNIEVNNTHTYHTTTTTGTYVLTHNGCTVEDPENLLTTTENGGDISLRDLARRYALWVALDLR